jgi:hypothetical protein
MAGRMRQKVTGVWEKVVKSPENGPPVSSNSLKRNETKMKSRDVVICRQNPSKPLKRQKSF